MNEAGQELMVLDMLEPENQDEAITVARALCPFAESMTDEAVLICVAYVELRGDLQAMERVTGFSVLKQSRAIRSSLAQRMIGQLSRIDLQGTGVMLAINALKDVASSASAAPAARVRASESLMTLAEAEQVRAGRGSGGDIKDLNSMTLDELQDFVQQMSENVTMIEGMSDAIDNEAD